MVMWMRIILFSLPFVISDDNVSSGVVFGEDFCFIPLGNEVSGVLAEGKAEFLEDCDTLEGLEGFKSIPTPAENRFYHHGVHPVVCCPKPNQNFDLEDYDYPFDENTTVSATDEEITEVI